jgi:site-specific DNA-methyltransferase (adenine-specific)
MDAKDDQRARRHRFTEWIRATGVTAQEINKATGTMMGSHYTTKQSQPAVMTREHLEACRALLGAIPEWVEVECDIRSLESKNYAGREVTGVRDVPIGHAFAGEVYGNTSDSKKVNITAPSTDAAKKWQGWGTALKPAVEPIVLARKPLIGTVAENVMTHGTGALNIDASRIGTSKDIPGSANGKGETFGYMRGWGYKNATMSSHNPNIGRWPANILLDEEAAAMLDEQSGEAGGGFGRMGKLNGGATKWGFDGVGQEVGYGDSGGASRFFYVAKASSAERNNGLDGLPQGSAFDGKNGQLGGNLGSKSGLRANIHPTVKPVDLMAYLIRLVARKDSVILDPFLGSGTTAIAAIQEGVRWIGCEREPDYVEIIQGRISAAQPGLGLNLEQSA